MTIENSPIDVSVVVPVRDEEDSIRDLLNALLQQTLRPTEIVITDGGSSDSTVEIIEEFVKAGAPVKLIQERGALPGRGRNIGVQNASCAWIAFIDGGNVAELDWLENLTGGISASQDIDVVYGSFHPVANTFFAECAGIAYLPPPVPTEAGPVRDRFIASSLIRRSTCEAVGGFPEHLRSAEDLVFMQNIDRQGFKSARAPRAIVHWQLQPTLWRTFKRFVVYARNNIRAGLWREWQLAIFERYAVLALLCAPAFFVGARWLLTVLAGWLLLLIARATNAIHKYRYAAPAGTGRHLARVFVIVPILATLDLAAFIGSLHWLLADKLRLMGARSS
jgi:glycosyltransferase involved in cell wall biosynthesis